MGVCYEESVVLSNAKVAEAIGNSHQVEGVGHFIRIPAKASGIIEPAPTSDKGGDNG